MSDVMPRHQTYKCDNCKLVVTAALNVLHIGDDFNTGDDMLSEYQGSWNLCDNCERSVRVAIKKYLPGLDGVM